MLSVYSITVDVFNGRLNSSHIMWCYQLFCLFSMSILTLLLLLLLLLFVQFKLMDGWRERGADFEEKKLVLSL